MAPSITYVALLFQIGLWCWKFFFYLSTLDGRLGSVKCFCFWRFVQLLYLHSHHYSFYEKKESRGDFSSLWLLPGLTNWQSWRLGTGYADKFLSIFCSAHISGENNT